MDENILRFAQRIFLQFDIFTQLSNLSLDAGFSFV